jgi:hypothetical protein
VLGADPNLDVFQAAHAFLVRHERLDEAELWAERARVHADRMARAAAEREQFHPEDPVEPHQMSDALLDRLRGSLREHRAVERAYLVRKTVELFPGSPVYVLLVESRDASLQQQLAASLSVSDTWFCLVLGGISRRARQHLLEAAGDPFYER